MSDRAGFYRVDDLISHGKDRSMSESCHDLSSAVDSRKLAVFLISAEFQRLLDHRGKVFLIINMNHSRICYDLRREHAVRVGFLRRHQTVCGKEDRSRDIRKFLLLILPCSSEIALQVSVFL